MTYLIIFVIVAAAGIGSLYLHQRRQRAHLDSVDGFRESLLRISSHRVAVPQADGLEPHSSVHLDQPSRGPAPLDPARREAARRRLEARRTIRSH